MENSGNPSSSRRPLPPQPVGRGKSSRGGGLEPPKRSRIIGRDQVVMTPDRALIVGGDPAECFANEAPAIVIEQQHGRLARILVTCPCGRHAELIADDEH